MAPTALLGPPCFITPQPKAASLCFTQTRWRTQAPKAVGLGGSDSWSPKCQTLGWVLMCASRGKVLHAGRRELRLPQGAALQGASR